MATKAAHKRLTKEYKSLQESSPPYITARPSEANILEWHYIIDGPKDTPYEDGQYHGTVIFPPQYPFKPPAIRMITPNGKFSPNAKLCLSMSDFHPELWNPAWNVSTILNGLLSFMNSNDSTTGSVRTTDADKVKLAKASLGWNSNSNNGFKKIFPDIIEKNKLVLAGKLARKSMIKDIDTTTPKEAAKTLPVNNKIDSVKDTTKTTNKLDRNSPDYIKSLIPPASSINGNPKKHVQVEIVDLDSSPIKPKSKPVTSKTTPEIIDLDDDNHLDKKLKLNKNKTKTEVIDLDAEVIEL